MSYVDIPLTMFVGGHRDLIERLYSAPDINNPEHLTQERDDYHKLLEIEPPKNYNPTRVTQPSYFIDDELAPVFGDRQISFYDPLYLMYSQIKEHIYSKFEEDGNFRYTFQSKDDDDVIGCYELENRDDIKTFIIHIIQTAPSTLYDIADNIGLSNIK
jgi:hypothetical protein